MIQLCYALVFSSLFVDCSGDQTASAPNKTSIPADMQFVGRWKLESKQSLENGHDVTSNNMYDFYLDGTFTNSSNVKLSNGDTGELLDFEADAFYSACKKGWEDTVAGIRRFIDELECRE